MSLALFLLAVWGDAYVVSYSRVFGVVHRFAALVTPQFYDHYQDETGAWIRKPTGRTWLGELLECPACVGWWTGLALSWFALSPSLPYVQDCQAPRVVAALIDGSIAAGFCFVMGTLRMLADGLIARWGKP